MIRRLREALIQAEGAPSEVEEALIQALTVIRLCCDEHGLNFYTMSDTSYLRYLEEKHNDS